MYPLNYLNLGEYQQVLRTAYLVRFLSEWTLSSTAGRERRRTRNIQTESEEGKNTQAEGREKDISGKKNPHQEGEEDCCCPVGKLCAIQIHLKKWQSAQDSQEVFAT